MLSALLLFAASTSLATPHPPTLPTSAPVTREQIVRDNLIIACTRMIKDVDDVLDQLDIRFGFNVNVLHPGFILRTEEVPRSVKSTLQFRIIIAAIYQHGPAMRATIRPGDRIVKLGRYTLTNETPEIIMAQYLSKYPVQVPLTLERHGKTFQVTLRREKLPCVQVIYDHFPAQEWRKKHELVRAELIEIRKALQADADPEFIAAVLIELKLIRKFQEDSLSEMLDQLDPVNELACGVTTEEFAQ